MLEAETHGAVDDSEIVEAQSEAAGKRVFAAKCAEIRRDRISLGIGQAGAAHRHRHRGPIIGVPGDGVQLIDVGGIGWVAIAPAPSATELAASACAPWPRATELAPDAIAP
jgi:hypothetical protein